MAPKPAPKPKGKTPALKQKPSQSISANWAKSTVTTEKLEELAESGVLPPQSEISWRASEEESRPLPDSEADRETIQPLLHKLAALAAHGLCGLNLIKTWISRRIQPNSIRPKLLCEYSGHLTESLRYSEKSYPAADVNKAMKNFLAEKVEVIKSISGLGPFTRSNPAPPESDKFWAIITPPPSENSEEEEPSDNDDSQSEESEAEPDAELGKKRKAKGVTFKTDEILAKTNKLLEVEVKLRKELEANLKDLSKRHNNQKKKLHAAEELVKQFSTFICETFNSIIGPTEVAEVKDDHHRLRMLKTVIRQFMAGTKWTLEAVKLSGYYTGVTHMLEAYSTVPAWVEAWKRSACRVGVVRALALVKAYYPKTEPAMLVNGFPEFKTDGSKFTGKDLKAINTQIRHSASLITETLDVNRFTTAYDAEDKPIPFENPAPFDILTRFKAEVAKKKAATTSGSAPTLSTPVVPPPSRATSTGNPDTGKGKATGEDNEDPASKTTYGDTAEAAE
ncbi:unnamed protein product [Alopecurus aequalis]